MTNLSGVLSDAARARPDTAAVVHNGLSRTFAELDGLSARAATLLVDQGVRPGDRVALVLPNSVEFLVLYYAILRAGAVVVPMNPLLKAREIEHHLTDGEVGLVCTDGRTLEEVRSAIEGLEKPPRVLTAGALPAAVAVLAPQAEPVDRADGDTAVILYTSGTTGQPKGAELTHGSLACNAVAFIEATELRPGDVLFAALPLFHVFGLVCLVGAAVRAGARLALVERFDAGAALDLIDAQRVSVFVGVPTMFAALLAARREGDTSLRLAVSGGAAMPQPLAREFAAAMGAPVLEGYGMSETSPIVSVNLPGDRGRPGSVGRPIAGVAVRVVDDLGASLPAGEVGEVEVRGHNVMKGYWRRPASTAEVLYDGWLSTGDLGRLDEDGFLYIVDRKKDLVIRGGFNVYPREIEDVLHEHPAVAEAVVVAVPHESLGEEVAAAVVLGPGRTASADELREFVKSRVAPYKYPRHVWLLDELPKGATGKILRREVAAAAREGAL
ncbi:long-chain fatty acid--CoA ligase [Amycolatopsis sp. NPDC088138]|uniref:long-chain-fatty-acid--CoA ligase n=1 Tax=Amycolatopsis sp. NPDC088138 TaxID=3363938 RepID=UPI0038092AC1